MTPKVAFNLKQNLLSLETVDLELEKTYLVKFLPPEISSYQLVELLDIYLSATRPHPILRLRKKGDKDEITKKQPVGDDLVWQTEQTINLDKDEFPTLSRDGGKVVRKFRNVSEIYGQKIEIDVFQDQLLGLVLADFEFESEEKQINCAPPEFCLVEVTHEEFIVGGYLAGKSYQEIDADLDRLGYQAIR